MLTAPRAGDESPAAPYRAQQFFDESRRLFGEHGDDYCALLAAFALAWTYEELGDRERARALDEESLVRARELGNERMTAIALRGLASYAVDEGRSKVALSMPAESIRIFSHLGDAPTIAAILCEFAAALAVDARPRLAPSSSLPRRPCTSNSAPANAHGLWR